VGSQPPAAAIIAFDHINLQARNLGRAIDSYTNVLGLWLVRADRGESGSVRFASLHASELLIDLQPATSWSGGPSRLNHFCLLVEPADFDHLVSRLRSSGVEIAEGLVRRQGAFGFGVSVYIRDPDCHGIELKHYADPRLSD
jgi:catechol 2,3-dioxygenase-like lactoylglutathione lyase family enzyme